MATTTRTDALVERLFSATIDALELFSVHLGCELGLYRALESGGPATPPELAARAGIAERYAREWLEQQAVAGLLDLARDDDDPDRRAYALAPAHARVLAHPDDAAHVAPFAHLIAGIGGVLDEVVAAYRSGGGVPYAAYGRAFRHGQGHINRPAFSQELPTAWLDALPDVRDRLAAADRGPFDLVLVLETLHDLHHPVEALRAIRASLADGGAALIVDERVADRFAAPGDEVERMMYGWSVTHCLPTQMVHAPTAATGTVMRADTVRAYATAAGFGRVAVLPVDDDLFRLYRLDG